MALASKYFQTAGFQVTVKPIFDGLIVLIYLKQVSYIFLENITQGLT